MRAPAFCTPMAGWAPPCIPPQVARPSSASTPNRGARHGVQDDLRVLARSVPCAAGLTFASFFTIMRRISLSLVSPLPAAALPLAPSAI